MSTFSSLFFAIFLWTLVAVCRPVSAETIAASAVPNVVVPDALVSIVPAAGQSFLSLLLDIRWNDTPALSRLVSNSRHQVLFRIPSDAQPGTHRIFLQFDDQYTAEVLVTVHVPAAAPDSVVDGTDPNPSTQNGKPHDVGDNPSGLSPGQVGHHPSGGYGNHSIPCDSLHRIDGIFTDSVYASLSEWSGVVPLKGRFSNLYLDYCPDNRTMFLLNDWYLCTTEMDSSSCYNKFEFFTGAGAEHWEIWVYHSLQRGMRVLRNGVDVSQDTTYVLGGRYGFAPSPVHDTAHTIYEFGIRVMSGLFFLPAQDDPYRPPVNAPKVETVCDQNDIEGWGLVREPFMYGGELRDDSVVVRQYQRYIPLAGATGLVREPVVFGGMLSTNSMTIRTIGSGATSEHHYECANTAHTIDGAFTDSEWSGRIPAEGRYSSLYADYCDGTLYILNDWILATEQPHEQSCYNLFELFTGNGREHWGIFVYNDKSRAIRVFRNGIDVTADTTIVHGGAYSWGISPLEPVTPHTLYEFGITAQEGGWMLFLADPGPGSFCSSTVASSVQDAASLPSDAIHNVACTVIPGTSSQELVVTFDIDHRDYLSFTVFDVSGRRVQDTPPTQFTAGRCSYTIPLQNKTQGVFLLRIAGRGRPMVIPFSTR